MSAFCKDMKDDLRIKLITIGDSGCGKTTFSETNFAGQPPRNTVPTIGVEFHSKVVDFADRRVRIQIWDTAGQERYRSITRAYYGDCIGAFVFFDHTRRDTFTHVDYWLKQLKLYADPELTIIMIGTHRDQEYKYQISVEEAQKLADDHGVGYFQICSMEPDFEPITRLCQLVLDRVERGVIDLDEHRGIALDYLPRTADIEPAERCCTIM